MHSWLRAGNRPTHYFDYPFTRWTWLYALRDFEIGGEAGSDAVSIVIPAGIDHHGPCGHNNLYFLDGPTHKSLVVPVFNDIPFTAIDGMDEFIAEQHARAQTARGNAEGRDARNRHAAAHSDIGPFLDQQR